MVLILFVTGCGGKSTYTELSYQQLVDKLENKDSFVLVIGSETCQHCADYKVTMEKVIKKNNIEIFYINLAGLSNEDYAKLYSKYTVSSTPTTLFIKNGEEESTYNRIAGAKSYADVVNTLKKQGYLG